MDACLLSLTYQIWHLSESDVMGVHHDVLRHLDISVPLTHYQILLFGAAFHILIIFFFLDRFQLVVKLFYACESFFFHVTKLFIFFFEMLLNFQLIVDFFLDSNVLLGVLPCNFSFCPVRASKITNGATGDQSDCRCKRNWYSFGCVSCLQLGQKVTILGYILFFISFVLNLSNARPRICSVCERIPHPSL